MSKEYPYVTEISGLHSRGQKTASFVTPALAFHYGLWIALAAAVAACVGAIASLEWIDINQITQNSLAIQLLTPLYPFLFAFVVYNQISSFFDAARKYQDILKECAAFGAEIAAVVRPYRTTKEGAIIHALTRWNPYFVAQCFFNTDHLLYTFPIQEAADFLHSKIGLVDYSDILMRSISLIEENVLTMDLSPEGIASVLRECRHFRNSVFQKLPSKFDTSMSILQYVIIALMGMYYVLIAFFLWPVYGWNSVFIYPFVFIISAALPLTKSYLGSPFEKNDLEFKRVYRQMPHSFAYRIDGFWFRYSDKDIPHEMNRYGMDVNVRPRQNA